MITKEEIEKRILDSYEVPNNVKETIHNPLVSIRTSTYQHAKFIIECIEGVLMQKTYFPIEYIIGEDFSTDGTREIVLEYARKYPNIIRVITADYNVGSKANGRRCIRACRGKYIAICEGDDYWIDPLKLQKQVDFLEANPDYNLVYTGYETLNHRDNQKKYYKCKRINIPYYDYFIKYGNPIATLTVCAKRNDIISASEKISEIPFRLLMGDLPLWIEMSRIGKFKVLNDITATYRILEESASNCIDPIKKIQFIENSTKIKKYFNEKYKSNISDKYIDYSNFKTCIRALYYYNNPKLFYQYTIKAILKYPSLLLDIKFIGNQFLYLIKNLQATASN